MMTVNAKDRIHMRRIKYRRRQHRQAIAKHVTMIVVGGAAGIGLAILVMRAFPTVFAMPF